jgi:hypothetical protein
MIEEKLYTVRLNHEKGTFHITLDGAETIATGTFDDRSVEVAHNHSGRDIWVTCMVRYALDGEI